MSNAPSQLPDLCNPLAAPSSWKPRPLTPPPHPHPLTIPDIVIGECPIAEGTREKSSNLQWIMSFLFKWEYSSSKWTKMEICYLKIKTISLFLCTCRNTSVIFRNTQILISPMENQFIVFNNDSPTKKHVYIKTCFQYFHSEVWHNLLRMLSSVVIRIFPPISTALFYDKDMKGSSIKHLAPDPGSCIRYLSSTKDMRVDRICSTYLSHYIWFKHSSTREKFSNSIHWQIILGTINWVLQMFQ